MAVKISLQSGGVVGGGFDNVPTGANCAWETYKYIRRNRVAWETVGAIVLTSRDRVTAY